MEGDKVPGDAALTRQSQYVREGAGRVSVQVRKEVAPEDSASAQLAGQAQPRIKVRGRDGTKAAPG